MINLSELASPFKSYRCLSLFGCFLLLICQISAFSQRKSQAELLKFTNRADSLVNRYPAEKIYIQFDKPDYALGDTIWLKAYLFNAPSLLLSAQSGILHIDIANDSNKVVKQYLLPVVNGITWGNIGLDKKDFLPGNYTLRAYTNWSRNFGDETFFYKRFSVLSLENKLLVSSHVDVSQFPDHYKVNTILKFTDANAAAITTTPMQLQVFSGDKRLYKQKLVTDSKGLLAVNFDIPPKAANINLIAEDEKQPGKMLIPINLSRTENADIQFLPEGGSLVAGIPAHIGFKALVEDGRGVDVKGVILDKEGREVASIQSLHKGMGSFDLNVQSDEVYTAKIMLPGGAFKNYQLPSVKNSGTALRIINNPGKDSLDVIVAATNDISAMHQNYFLIAKARGIVCYAAILNFDKGNINRFRVAQRLFPTGITHFALMTSENQPLNERLIFINHKDDLQIDIAPAETLYAVKDSIALHLSVTDNMGKPVQGNFSLAVTDDSQVKHDTLGENIASRLWLTSDLKGYIEQPGYYFSSASPDKLKALDNLLLTQGWVSYDLKSSVTLYEAEHEYKVSGKVANVFNKRLKGTRVMILSKSPVVIRDTLTDNEGRFSFTNFPKIDTPAFMIQALNKNGKKFNVGVTIDEAVSPEFVMPVYPQVTPWYVNADTTLLNFAVKDQRAQVQQYLPGSGHTLHEVKITAKKIIKDSQNLNEDGGSDQTLNEKDIEKVGKKTVLQLLQEHIKGFRVGEFTLGGVAYFSYFINDKWIIFFMDGTRLNYGVYLESLNDLTAYFKYLEAEDVKGIEVMSGSKYMAVYKRIFMEYDTGPADKFQFAFVEITTRSGSGPVLQNTPGTYLYKPLALSWPKQFYKPKYAVNDTTRRIDLRSTINWEPNVTTDSVGKATVSFYAASEPTTYSVILEGTDLNGNIGYKRLKINVVRRRRETTKSK